MGDCELFPFHWFLSDGPHRTKRDSRDSNDLFLWGGMEDCVRKYDLSECHV